MTTILVIEDDLQLRRLLRTTLAGPSELLARIRVAVRRVLSTTVPDVLEVGPIKIDQPRHMVTVRGQEVHLTPIEFRLLVELARQPGRVLTHHQLLRDIWGPDPVEDVHNLRVHMAALRKKPAYQRADPGSRMKVVTVSGGVIPNVRPTARTVCRRSTSSTR